MGGREGGWEGGREGRRKEEGAHYLLTYDRLTE